MHYALAALHCRSWDSLSGSIEGRTEQDLLPPPDLEAINYRTVSENPLVAYSLLKKKKKKLYQD